MSNETFNEEEIKAAKATRDKIIMDDIQTLKAIYMAGEICMWDELRNRVVIDLRNEPCTPPVEDGKQGGEAKTAAEILKKHFVKYYRKDFPQNPPISDDDLYKKVRVFYEEENTILSAMEEYKSQPSTPVQDNWIAVEDGKQPFGELVLVGNCNYQWLATAKFIHHKWEMDDKNCTIIKPTHWQPLPSPPVNRINH